MAIAVGTKDVQDEASSNRAFRLDMLASKVKLGRSWRRYDRATTVR
jgi:hypothetical protein